jgi:hypothetical protein
MMPLVDILSISGRKTYISAAWSAVSCLHFERADLILLVMAIAGIGAPHFGANFVVQFACFKYLILIKNDIF